MELVVTTFQVQCCLAMIRKTEVLEVLVSVISQNNLMKRIAD